MKQGVGVVIEWDRQSGWTLWVLSVRVRVSSFVFAERNVGGSKLSVLVT